MNAQGIPVFYGARELEAALAEVRPLVGSNVVIAEFEIIRPLKLLDVEALKAIEVDGDPFNPDYLRRAQQVVDSHPEGKARIPQFFSLTCVPTLVDCLFDLLRDDSPATAVVMCFAYKRRQPALPVLTHPSVA